MVLPNGQGLQWTEVLCCCVCSQLFDSVSHDPVTLSCGHTGCRPCLEKVRNGRCPFDQTPISVPVAHLLSNTALLRILDLSREEEEEERGRGRSEEGEGEAEHKWVSQIQTQIQDKDQLQKCLSVLRHLQHLAAYFRRVRSERGGSVWSPHLSRPLQRKLVALLCTQLLESDGRLKTLKAARYLGERSLTELLLLHQNPNHLSSNLWSSVRARGCQFLGPAMQEEVLKLILLTLSEGAMISRKTLVLYIVQTLAKDYPQSSKTSVGHVVQLLYRASCFNVLKRDGESSLMQLKEEYRNYEALRREHDAQIVHIAMESGLRISPDQWSALLYGDQAHRSHMQSIIDKLQSPQTFGPSVQELVITLQRMGDPSDLSLLVPHLELLASVDPLQNDAEKVDWNLLGVIIEATRAIVDGQVSFCQKHGPRVVRNLLPLERNGLRGKTEGTGSTSVVNEEKTSFAVPSTDQSAHIRYKYKTSMCRDITMTGSCPRGRECTFAHSPKEISTFRMKAPTPKVTIDTPFPLVQSTNNNFSPPDYEPGPPPTPITNTNTQQVAQMNSMMMGQAGHVPPGMMMSGPPPPFRLSHPPVAYPSVHPPTLYIPASDSQPTFLTSQQTAGYPATARFVLVQTATPVPTPMPSILQCHVGNALTVEQQHHIDPQLMTFQENNLLLPIPMSVTEAQPQIIRQQASPTIVSPASSKMVFRDELQHLKNKREEIVGRLDSKKKDMDLWDYEAASLSYSVASSVLAENPIERQLPKSYPQHVHVDCGQLRNHAPHRESGMVQEEKRREGECETNEYPASSTWNPFFNSPFSLWSYPPTMAGNKRTSVISSLPTTVVSHDPTTIIKNAIPKPVSTPVVQSHHAPMVSYDSVDPEQIVDFLPAVIRAQKRVAVETKVGQGIERIVEAKQSLGQMPAVGPVAASAVEKEHLKWELHIFNQQIENVDNVKEAEVLERELQYVNQKIHQLEPY